jgi:hypothetical protein
MAPAAYRAPSSGQWRALGTRSNVWSPQRSITSGEMVILAISAQLLHRAWSTRDSGSFGRVRGPPPSSASCANSLRRKVRGDLRSFLLSSPTGLHLKSPSQMTKEILTPLLGFGKLIAHAFYRHDFSITERDDFRSAAPGNPGTTGPLVTPRVQRPTGRSHRRPCTARPLFLFPMTSRTAPQRLRTVNISELRASGKSLICYDTDKTGPDLSPFTTLNPRGRRREHSDISCFAASTGITPSRATPRCIATESSCRVTHSVRGRSLTFAGAVIVRVRRLVARPGADRRSRFLG